MKTTIKYIAFYNTNSANKKENRNTFLAINNKVDYVCDAINRNGYEVEIISPCWSNNNKGFYSGGSYSISKDMKLRNFATFGSRSLIGKKVKQLFSLFQLLLFLLSNTKKGEQIIVYHSLAMCTPIRVAKIIKKLSIILEVEEIYTDVWKNKGKKGKEIKYIERADKYIFVSDILKKKFNSKPSTVLYGGYELIKEEYNSRIPKETIDIVYAGSIDEIKGGAKNAVLSAEYLPENYKIHILGFGDKKTVNKILGNISSINSRKGYKCCEYHGTMTGNKYKEFLLNCDIGLNPQYEGEYMNTAFPSKVLSYLSHNLIVVSTRIKSIQESKISKFIFFTENDSPESIAKSIKAINIKNRFNTTQLIKDLDQEFLKNIDNLLKNDEI